MGTAETLIVFSALMALIALVAIGIDWIGKPLKNRRFIPRMYRFEDEKLPIDAYGNTTLPTIATLPPGYAGPTLPAYTMASVQPTQAGLAATGVMHAPAGSAAAGAARQVPVVPSQPAPRQVASVSAATGSGSAFSDIVAGAKRTATEQARSAIAGSLQPERTAGSWTVGMALDATVDGVKPSLAIKAERFWKTTADSLSVSHFDVEDVQRMATGKAPRRANPRTGRIEAVQLTGLRRASSHTDVRMHWPGESIDPWSAS